MELWDPQTRYKTGDVVFFQGGTYQALSPNSGSFIPRGLQPGSAGAFAFWQLIGGTPFIQTIVTNAQLLALAGTGVTSIAVIPAQGPNQVIVPISQYFRLKWTADYTNINANAAFGIFPASGSGNIFYNPLDETNGAGAKVSTLLAPGGDFDVLNTPLALTLFGSPTPTTAISVAGYGPIDANVAIPLYFNNAGGGPLTGGNAANKLLINVSYQVFDISSL